ncbi:MAG TPA: ethanolamine ammonia-lyase subunit EutC [Dongiaceae bacterium]|nr:ethanolamine ammonia-lyase subunit EutC [Dongiaceae bacterium]
MAHKPEGDRDSELTPPDVPEIVRKIRVRTPARLLVGRVGATYRTATQLELREAHAAARDAARSELNLERDLGSDFLERWNLLENHTRATTKDEYLLRPDLGRQLDDSSRPAIQANCTPACDLQIAIGDGLSVAAVVAQVPSLLPLLCAGAQQRRWQLGRILVIHHCRVGILNEIGELLRPRVAVLLIGERPGLATAESLSVYIAAQPNKLHTDANRHVISNIHARGLAPHQAAERILALAARLMNSVTNGPVLPV